MPEHKCDVRRRLRFVSRGSLRPDAALNANGCASWCVAAVGDGTIPIGDAATPTCFSTGRVPPQSAWRGAAACPTRPATLLGNLDGAVGVISCSFDGWRSSCGLQCGNVDVTGPLLKALVANTLAIHLRSLRFGCAICHFCMDSLLFGEHASLPSALAR